MKTWLILVLVAVAVLVAASSGRDGFYFMCGMGFLLLINKIK